MLFTKGIILQIDGDYLPLDLSSLIKRDYIFFLFTFRLH